MKRIELITSEEYWKTRIALGIWNHFKMKKKSLKYKKCEKIAEKIVDDYFMETITELKEH